MIFYKPIPNSLIFQTLTSFHRSQPPNDPQFCALPFLKALTLFGLIEHLHLLKNQFIAYPRIQMKTSFLQQEQPRQKQPKPTQAEQRKPQTSLPILDFLDFFYCC